MSTPLTPNLLFSVNGSLVDPLLILNFDRIKLCTRPVQETGSNFVREGEGNGEPLKGSKVNSYTHQGHPY